ncbi:MAG: LamG-like jellyroll fold domain-containing protein [Candidatus Micrarchaeota archaeon]
MQNESFILKASTTRFFILLLVLLCSASLASAAQNISECANLTSANTEYVLNQSISGIQAGRSMCIDIQNTNITLDCAGYSINGANVTSTSAVYSNATKTTVRNCQIADYYTGVWFAGSNSNAFDNNITSLMKGGQGIFIGNPFVSTPTSGRAAFWSFDSNVSTNATGAVPDDSGNNNNGTLGGGNSSRMPIWGIGIVNGAYTFDGINDYIDFGNSSSLNQPSITISMWIYPNVDSDCDAQNNWRSILRTGTATWGTPNGYDIILEEDRSITWDVGTNSPSRLFSWGKSIQVKTWTHLAFTYNAATGAQKTYQNGMLIASKFSSGPALPGDATFVLSKGLNAVACPVGDGFLNGSLDQVYVYNYAFSESQIGALYSNSISSFNITRNNVSADSYGVRLLSSKNSYITNNSFRSANTSNISLVYMDSSSSPNVFLLNNLTANYWMNNLGSANTFNDSTMGNIYYFSNESGAWTVYNITDSNANNWADGGRSRPFSATTLGSRWAGSGSDWHPYTLVPGPPFGIDEFYLLPENTVRKNEVLNCTLRVSNDGNNSDVLFEWYKNGVNQSPLAGTYANLRPDVLTSITSVTSAYLSAGDVWYCKILAQFTPTNSSGWMASNNVTVTACMAFTTPNTEYDMTSDVYVNGSSCMDILASDVTLDCAGHKIIGNGTAGTSGVYANKSGTIIRNCVVEGFDKAIYLDQGSTNAQLRNNSLHTNTSLGYGVYSGGSHGISIINNTILSDNGISLLLLEGFSNSVEHNLINSSNYSAIYVAGFMQDFDLSYNIIGGNRSLGLDVIDLQTGIARNASVLGNIVYGGMIPCGNNYLIRDNYFIARDRVLETWCGSRNHVYINNTVIATAGMAYWWGDVAGGSTTTAPNITYINNTFNATGIAFYSPYPNSGGINLTGNRFISSTSYGLYLVGFGIPASGNSFYSGTSSPLYMVGARNNTFVNNTFSSNSALPLVDITATSYNNLFYWNNFTNATGFYARDLNGNNYYNNTNPLAFTNLANISIREGAPLSYVINATPTRSEGNLWYNVLNGNVQINGSAVSLYSPAFYIGSAGSGYPYNTANSAGKLSGTIADYAPLTPFYTNATTPAAISCFTVNDSNFSISCSGNLTNATKLRPGTYSLNITVNDTLGQIKSGIIVVRVFTPSSGGSNQRPLRASYQTRCPDNKLVVTVTTAESTVPGAAVKLFKSGLPLQLIAEQETDDNGNAYFTLDNAGDYEIDVSSLGYEPVDTIYFSYALCEAKPECNSDAACAADQYCSNGNCTIVLGSCGYADAHKWVSYECCADSDCAGYCQEHKCLQAQQNQTPPAPPQQNTTNQDAGNSLSAAQDAIAAAKAAGKDTSAAEADFAEAQAAYEAGNYELAKQLAEQAKILALNSKAAANATQPVTPSAGQQKGPDLGLLLLLLAIAGSIVIGGIILFFIFWRRRSRGLKD